MSDQPSGFFARRLLRLNVLAALLVAATVVAVIGLRQAGFHYRTQERQARLVSTLLAADLAPSLALNEVDRAEAALAALRAEPRIAAAAVYDLKGQIVASYRRADLPGDASAKPGKLELLPETAPRAEIVDGRRAVEAAVDVLSNGASVGTFYLRQEIEWPSFITPLVLVGLGVLVGVALLALFFSSLQEEGADILTGELSELTALVRNADARHDYTASVPLRGPARGRELAQALQQLLRGFAQREREQADALRASRSDLDTLRASAARLQSRKEDLERQAAARPAPAAIAAPAPDSAGVPGGPPFLDRLRQELRDPLQAILQGVRALKRDRQLTNPPHRELVAIEGNATHLLTAVDDALDLAAALSSGPAEPAPFDLPDLLAGVVEVARFRAGAQGSIFTFEPVGALPKTVAGDARRLRQLLGGLLGNAARLTPRRGRIDLVVGAVEGKIRFEVRDTGAPRDVDSVLALKTEQAEALVALLGGALKTKATPEGVNVFRFDLALPTA